MASAAPLAWPQPAKGSQISKPLRTAFRRKEIFTESPYDLSPLSCPGTPRAASRPMSIFDQDSWMARAPMKQAFFQRSISECPTSNMRSPSPPLPPVVLPPKISVSGHKRSASFDLSHSSAKRPATDDSFLGPHLMISAPRPRVLVATPSQLPDPRPAVDSSEEISVTIEQAPDLPILRRHEYGRAISCSALGNASSTPRTTSPSNTAGDS